MTYWKPRSKGNNSSSGRRPKDNFTKGQSRDVRERKTEQEVSERGLIDDGETLEGSPTTITHNWR